ncbi:MAG: MerR family transcriptional regulator [Paracoccaceae bacterium]
MAGKSPDAFRTISEVADWLDRPAHVLRFWESKFNQVKPVKRAGGRRYYRPEDMLLLGGIKKLLHDDGMTIKGAQKVLREQGVRYVTAMSQPLDDDGAVQTVDAFVEAGEAAAASPAPMTGTIVQTSPAPVAEMSARPPVPADLSRDDGASDSDSVTASEEPGDALPVAAALPEAPQEQARSAPPDVVAANSAAAPDPATPALGADLPPAPDLASIQPSPGLLSVIIARRDPIPDTAREAFVPILARLDDLIARLSAARRS